MSTVQALSFLLWYRPVYNAYMKESAVFYYAYFVFAGFHIAFCGTQVVLLYTVAPLMLFIQSTCLLVSHRGA